MSARLQVRALLAAKMESLGFTALEYRDEDDAISEGDLPCVLIQQAGPVEISRIEFGTDNHECSFLLSFAAITGDIAEAMMMSAVTAFADDRTLGAKVTDVRPSSYGDEDDDGRDYAVVVLEVRVGWSTSSADYGTLVYS